VRFGISTHLYHEQALAPEHLRELASFGFSDIELFATLGHFDYRDREAHRALGRWLSDAGLGLHSVHAPIVEHLRNGEWGPPLSTAAASEAARSAAVRETLAALEIARTVPFNFLVTHVGVPLDQAMADGNNRAAAERSLVEVGRACAALGVRLAIELIPNELSTAEALVGWIDDLDLEPPGIGICLDTGHAFLQGDLADAIDVVSGDLVTTHIHDNKGKADDHLVPFDGRIDWPTTLMTLQKVGYEGVYMLELANRSTPADVLRKTVEARRRFEQTVESW
jgi:sugar phosphate isomerase/epimerase